MPPCVICAQRALLIGPPRSPASAHAASIRTTILSSLLRMYGRVAPRRSRHRVAMTPCSPLRHQVTLGWVRASTLRHGQEQRLKSSHSFTLPTTRTRQEPRFPSLPSCQPSHAIPHTSRPVPPTPCLASLTCTSSARKPWGKTKNVEVLPSKRRYARFSKCLLSAGVSRNASLGEIALPHKGRFAPEFCLC